MSEKKEIAFEQLKQDFIACSNLVLSQLRLLEKYIHSGSTELPEESYNTIKKQEKEINKYEVTISKGVVDGIVLYAPVASELRQLMSYFRLAIILERIGDLCFNCVRSIRKIKDVEFYKEYAPATAEIFTITNQMVEKSLLAFMNEDIEYAIWIIKNDDMVDELNHSFIKKVVKQGGEAIDHKKALLTLVTLKSVVSNIERIADNATNIAEVAIYSVEGKDVRHKKISSIEIENEKID